MFDSPVPSERARLAGEVEGGSKDEIDPEDHPLTRVRWSQPLVASTCELPPVVDSERKALFYSREDELATRAMQADEAEHAATSFVALCHTDTAHGTERHSGMR